MIRQFINLTAGIEAIERLELVGEEIEFVRIASTDCEHKLGNPQWDAILCELDSNLLMALARGDECIVYDCSKARELSHALSQGIGWIRWVLEFAWFGRITRPLMVDGEDLSRFFGRQWLRHTSRRAKARVFYFARLLEKSTKGLDLKVVCLPAKHDGDWEYYKQVLRDVGR